MNIYRLLLLSEACSVSTFDITHSALCPACNACRGVNTHKMRKGKEEGSPAAAVGSVLSQNKSSVDQDGPLVGLLTLWS